MSRLLSFLCAMGLAVTVASTRVASQSSSSVRPGEPAVSVREDVVVIPTYPTGEPLKAPMFFAGRTYQGAKGPMYPYVLVDRLSYTREPRTYRVVWLENEFIRIGILPELGGRIWEGRDKTNGYDFFYKNTVIKPALIGMVGAWISGGVEWNIPHHHRASSFMPVQYLVERRPDGAGTVWLGELELRHRMRWVVGLTLSPGRSTLDATVRLINRTPVAHSFLYFANVAVHANDDYQVVFPPNTEYGTHHAKNQFTSWPISRQIYGGVDFTRGVDVSWWKNHPSPTSIFAWNYEDDFLAGYDHGRQAGTMHVADHLTVPGKKFFEWGPGDEGRYWDSLLTDADGPYLELMVGGYSDNQPDYTWIQPAETKEITQTWYPIRELGAPKQATREAAVNLEPAAAGAVRLAFNATRVHPAATVRLVAAPTRVLFERQVAIGPAAPFSTVVTVPAGTAHTDLVAILIGQDGRELVRYQPRPPADAAMPPPVVPPAAPGDIRASEEVYLAGLRLDQFYSPAAEPEPYYEESIRRDSGDARALTALAVRLLKRGLFAQAAVHAEKAAARVTRNYTSPRDGDALYYLGVAHLGLGDDTAAEPVLAKAAWDPAWRSAAYTRLAEISLRRRRLPEALERARRALAGERANTRALVLQALALLKLGRVGEARDAAGLALRVDPLDSWARDVEWHSAAAAASDRARGSERGVIGSYVSRGGAQEEVLEAATDYASVGMYEEALSLLNDRPTRVPPASEHAMIAYARAEYAERLGRPDEAARHAREARAASTDYVFPFRIEHIPLLRRAVARDPGDPRAPYYLGNLLADIQPDAAVDAWRAAVHLEPAFAMAHRNLGWMAGRRGDTREAIDHYERALAADPHEPVFYYEIDRLHESANTVPSKRLALLETHRDVVLQRDDSVSRLVRLYVRLGQHDRALDLLSSRRFSTWEGGTRFLVHDDYVNAHLLRGTGRLREGRAADALRDFEAALAYPPNLGVARPNRGGREVEVQYFVGRAHAALGHPAPARAAWNRAAELARVTARGDEAGVQQFYQARALDGLGERQRAQTIYAALVESGQRRLSPGHGVDFFAKFSEQHVSHTREAQAHYLIGLGQLGLGRADLAREAFERCLRLDVNHVWAAEQLKADPR